MNKTTTLLSLVLLLSAAVTSFGQDQYFQKWIDIGVSSFNKQRTADLTDESFELRTTGVDANGQPIYGKIVDWSITFEVEAVEKDPPGSGVYGVGIKISVPNLDSNSNGAFEPTPVGSPVPTYDFGNATGLDWGWDFTTAGVKTITVSGALDLEKVNWNAAGVVINYEIFEGLEVSPPGPGGDYTVAGRQFSGSLSRYKPGDPILGVPDPYYVDPTGSGGGCSSCGCANSPAGQEKIQLVRGHSSNESLQQYLVPDRVQETADAEKPDVCPDCGSDIQLGGAPKFYLERFYNPQNLFYPTSTGRGSFSNIDYALMFRNQGDAVAVMYDPLTNQIVKFGQVMTPGQQGGGNTLVPTENFEPEDQHSFGAFSVYKKTGPSSTVPVTDPILESETGEVYVDIPRNNGWVYKFRLINRIESRLEKITSPQGDETIITYRADYPTPIGFTNEQIVQSPTRVKQIYQVTGPDGDTATFTYHTTKKNGRWAVSDIQFASGRALQYLYDTDGYLTEVKKKRNSTANYVTLSKYIFEDADEPNNKPNASIEQHIWNGRYFTIKTRQVADDYRVAAEAATDGVTDKTWDDDNEFGGLGSANAEQLKLFNQVGGGLIGIDNGMGQRELTVHRKTNETLMRLVRGNKVMEWSPGKSVRYATSMPSDPSNFALGSFEDDSNPGVMFADHPGVTESQLLANNPPTTRDVYGRELEHEYDANGNLEKTKYDVDPNTGIEASYEEWKWDLAKNVLEKYRDREGRITLYERDADYRITAITRGLRSDGSGGYTGPDAMKTVYKYDSNGLLEWTGTVPYGSPDPGANYRTTYLYDTNNRIKEIQKPAIQTAVGTFQRPITKYTWVEDHLDSMEDEKGNDITFEYDDYGRLIRTNYVADGSKSEIWYDDANLKIYRKDRAGSVHLDIRDAAGRVSITYRNYGKDTGTILDNAIQTVNTSTGLVRSKTRYVYNAGESLPKETFTNEVRNQVLRDYRGRAATAFQYIGTNAGSYERAITTYYLNRPFQMRHTVRQAINGSYNYSEIFSYQGYSAQNEKVRTVQCRDAGGLADNLAVLDLNRDDPETETPSYMINDVVRDLSGNVIELQGPDDTVTRYVYDDSGQQTSQTRAFGTSEATTSTTDYDDYGNIFAIVGPDGIRTEQLYDPAGNLTETKVIPTGGTLADQVTKYTYTIKGQPHKTIANDGTVTEHFYSQCCGGSVGTKNALGHGTITNSDAQGRAVHSVTVGNFDTEWLNPHDVSTANTYSELTTRYGVDGRVQFTTRWTQDPTGSVGAIDVNNPPIAGLDSIPANHGITTQYVYDNQLNSGSGLETAAGMAIIPIQSGSHATINIVMALNKFAEPEANGGAELSPHTFDPLSATVVISPDEKSMQVSISNSTGQRTMTALMEGPALTAPGTDNKLIDWTCRRRGRWQTGSMIPGHASTVESKTIYPDGTTVKRYVNGFGQTVAVYDQYGNRTRSIFDVAGSLTRAIDQLGKTTEFTYDKLGRRISSKDALNQEMITTYDSAGRVKTFRDAKHQTTTNNYDGFGRIEEVVDKLGGTTKFAFDTMNRLVTLTDAEHKITTYEYDDLGRRTKVTLHGATASTETTYDPAGRVKDFIQPSGIKRTMVYSAYSGELDMIDYYDSLGTLKGTDDFTYDDFLRKTASSSRDSVDNTFVYNDRGQVATESTTYGGQTYDVNYLYDDRGRMKEIEYPSGRKVAYTYEDVGMLDTISLDGVQIEDRNYDVRGLLNNVDRSFVDETRTYDDIGRLTAINNTNVGELAYVYDSNGNKTSESWSGVMSQWGFTTNSGAYDAEDRLLNFNQTGSSMSLELVRSDIGNISNYKNNSVDALRSFSDRHELTTVDGATQTFDVDGNLKQSHHGVDLTWDEAGMIKTTVVDATDTAGIEGSNQYGYDCEQKRSFKKIIRNGIVAKNVVYIYAGPNCIAEYGFGSLEDAPSQEYIYAHSIDSIIMVLRNNGSEKLNVHRNQQWSVTAITDASDGSTKERYAYDAFGQRTILAPDGSTIRTASLYEMPYGYTSRRHDVESGLMYFRARNYDSTTGEFTSKDPLEYVDGMSSHRAYFSTHLVDPTGTIGAGTHHPLPLYLGGTNQQLGVKLSKSAHMAAHRYLSSKGVGFGHADTFKAMSAKEQRAVIRGSLKAAGLCDKDINKLMKSAFKGATNIGTKTLRGPGYSRFKTNAITPSKKCKPDLSAGAGGAHSIAIMLAMAPYEIYLDEATSMGLEMVEEVGLCRSVQISTQAWSTSGRKFNSGFIYQSNGEFYQVNVVGRGDNQQLYIIARKFGTSDWVIEDDLSCPTTAEKCHVIGWNK
ncbi:MAG: RHS repeat-associated core domain-containing protein [Planctomycetota bacterium]